jgi:hypothetical protein
MQMTCDNDRSLVVGIYVYVFATRTTGIIAWRKLETDTNVVYGWSCFWLGTTEAVFPKIEPAGGAASAADGRRRWMDDGDVFVLQ